MDGLDELPEKFEDRVDKVLGRKKLSFCYVLATTRQEKGIETRKQLQFDMHLAIEGFSEADSFEYIRKHFRSIGTKHSSKGEMLIKEIARNPLLRDFKSNPLNLLLLCVVYEDHEGSLPSSITELYQTIVRCLLRRYCAREELKASKKGEDLEKQFEIPILALGELAWKCLLNDRLSFYEDELEELDRSNENIVARRLGLVYKEESLKRLKPRHAYIFLHKTFQEYLAASYIAHKFRGSEFQMLEQMLFPEIAGGKFKQVFVFVCGILREEANILFELIGNKLQKQWGSVWLKCDRLTADFFVDSWKETGNAKGMAKTLCSFLPFPRPLHVWNDEQCSALCSVLKQCAEFPEELTVAEVHISPYVCSEYVSDLINVFEDVNKTLEEKLTIALCPDVGWGMSELPDCGFSSLRLRICGSLGSSLLQDVKKLLLHKCLCSLSITVCGDQESLVEVLARGLEGESAVKFLDLCVNGNFSFHEAYLLEQGILRNRSLKKIKISVNGELPENWQAVSKNLRAQFAERAIVSEIYPNIFKKVKDSQVTHLNRFLSKTDLKQQTVTLNVWGELSGEGCKAVCEILLSIPVSHLTLNIHGELTDEMLRYIARCVGEQEKLSPITINAWVEMTEKENKLIKELGLDKNPSVSLHMRGTSASLKESSDSKVFSSDKPQSPITLFEKATKAQSSAFTEDTSQKSLTIKMNELEHDLLDGFAGNIYLKSRTLEINDCGDDNDEWGRGLGEGLARYTSLELLTVQITTASLVSSKWAHGLGEGLAGNTSLKSLRLEIEDYGVDNYEWGRGLGEGLTRNTSLESLTVKIIKASSVNSKWVHGLGEGLAGNTSLKSLTLVIYEAGAANDKWGRSLGEGLARNTTLESLRIEIRKVTFAMSTWEHGLGEGLAGNTSLKSLTLELYSVWNGYNEWGRGLAEGLGRNNSLESLTIKISMGLHWANQWKHGLGEGLAGNTSLKSLILEIESEYRGDDEWGHGLGEGLTRNSSLESLTVKIIQANLVSSEWVHGLGEGLAGNTSIKSFTLEIDNYGYDDNEWGRCLGESLARNTSLESLTVKIIKARDAGSEWLHGLGEGLAGKTSLKSLILEIYENHGWELVRGLRKGGDNDEWGRSLARNTSLESLRIKVIKTSFMSSEWVYGLGKGLAGNTSLKSLTLETDDDDYSEWRRGLGEGLARNTSMESLTLAINIGNRSNKWGHVLGECLAESNSLNSLTLTINNYSYISDEWGVALAEGLARNTSLKSITFTMNNYFYVSSVWGLGLFEVSARNTSLKSITLSINNYGIMKGERRHDIIEGLATNSSLTSVKLAINNYGDMKGEWGHCLFEGLARNTSLNSLTLTANNYGDMNEEGGCAVRERLRKCDSLTECNLIVDICGKC